MKEFFVRPIPRGSEYKIRLKEELQIIKKFQFEEYFIKVQEILALTPDIPHLTRGSAGSSLVCYLLGITDVDPIKENISMTRFMHERRDDKPDVDVDYPYHLREIVLDRVFEKYGDRAARVSNHITYKRKSALRQALRQRGYKQPPKDFRLSQMGLSPSEITQIQKDANELLGKVKGISLHCGGVVILDDPIEKEHLIKDRQLKYDKREVEKMGWVKIDLLSNRGLSQLYDISSQRIEDYPEQDEKTTELLSKGDTLGVTQAESPAFRKMLRALQPRNRAEMSTAMALIRPAAASRGRKGAFYEDWDRSRESELIVFEDDAIRMISGLLGISESEADYYRKGFAKMKSDVINDFLSKIHNHPDKDTILLDLSQLREFSLCKAHAVSYGKMVWALAYQKAHNPHKFWESTLNHAQSMYRHWVHVEEAKGSGLNVVVGKGDFVLEGDTLYPKNSQLRLLEEDPRAEYKKYKCWSGFYFPKFSYFRDNNRIVEFSGLIGTSRRMKKGKGETVTFVTIGTPKGIFDVVIDGYFSLSKYDYVEGVGEMKQMRGSSWISCFDFHFEKI